MPALAARPLHAPIAPPVGPAPPSPPSPPTQARLKIRDLVSIRALPAPALRVQKRLAVPLLQQQGLGLRLSYECPLARLGSFYRPPARLMLSIDNAPDQARARRRGRPALPAASAAGRTPSSSPCAASHASTPSLLQGIRLTSAGLEVDKALALGGGAAVLRGAGVLALPRELPVAEGEPLVRCELRRLGLKARW